MTKSRSNLKVRRLIIKAIGDEIMSSPQIAQKINASAVQVGIICSVLLRERLLERAGVVGQLPLWRVAGANNDVLAAPYSPRVPVPDRPELWPTSITAAVLGDPLPGRSALDRKRAGVE